MNDIVTNLNKTPKLVQKVFSETTSLIQHNILLVGGIILLMFITNWVARSLQVSGFNGFLASVISLSVILASSYLLIKLAIQKNASKSYSLQEIGFSLLSCIQLFFVTLIYMVMVIIGLLLLIFPGLYIATKFFFASIIVVDTKTSINQAFSRSAAITDKRMIQLFPIVLVSLLLPLLFYIPLLSQTPQLLQDLVSILITSFSGLFTGRLYRYFVD